MVDIHKIIDDTGIISIMMERNQLVGILQYLHYVLDKNIPGDIVELGCNVGTTSILIRKLLDLYGSDKKYHVYDSWDGLPNVTNKDLSKTQWKFKRGSCKTSKDIFIKNFTDRNLKLPIIHSGWFKDIPDKEYPEKICFAFFDGDFYTSIIDSFNKTYHKMHKGGIILIDDCGWNVLPGVELACNDFLKDKEEELYLTGYPDKNNIYGASNKGGIIFKK